MVVQIIQITQVQSFERLSFTHVTVHVISRLQNKATKALLKLRGINYKWHEFFNNTNRVAVVLLWLPVVLIYFMDLQIWYSIISTVVGGTIGLFSHLGEIRNISQLRLRFQFFSNAMQFNLMPEEKLLSQQATLLRKLRDAIHQLKLRYGLGKPFTKIESSQVDATRFALLWNEIIITFREEDILSDRELELLELPPNCWKIRVIRWPCFLLCNELLLALTQAKELENESDTSLWLKICKSEYRRCAVIEAYDSIKYLFLMILKVDKVEFSIVTNIFREIDYYIQEGRLTEKFKLSHRELVGVTDIDRWTLHLARRPVKEFVLEIWKGQRYKIPSCLFSCQGLHHLELFNRWIKPPSSSTEKTQDNSNAASTQVLLATWNSTCKIASKQSTIRTKTNKPMT
ncbi:unnamed protein product [Vicia faba]|uniref:Callose synthase helical domain-containing protein n=1 Tax=Vicia faba TaxID=3906 RepID=A0AAV0YE35_VICFA|nr:unnamed protein product [Vicia faba]